MENNNTEREQNVIDYMFYIIEQSTDNYKKPLDSLSKMAIHRFATEIYIQCIKKEITKYEEWNKSQQQISDNLKQSSVNFIIDKLSMIDASYYFKQINAESFDSMRKQIIETGRKIHNEEIKEAYWNGSDGTIEKTEILKEAEEYYNETFNLK